MRFQLERKKAESQVVEFLNRHRRYALVRLRCSLTHSLHPTTTLSRFFSSFKMDGKKTRKNAWRVAREGYTRTWAQPPFSAVRFQSRNSSILRSSYEIWLQPRLVCQSQPRKQQLNAVWTLHRAKKLENSKHVCDPTHLQRAVWIE